MMGEEEEDAAPSPSVPAGSVAGGGVWIVDSADTQTSKGALRMKRYE